MFILLGICCPLSAADTPDVKTILETLPEDLITVTSEQIVAACTAELKKKQTLNSGQLGQLYLYRGVAYLKMDDAKSAKADFLALVKLRAADPEPRRYLALTRIRLGEYIQAFEELTAVFQLWPKYAPAYAAASYGCHNAGDLRACITFASKAIEVDPVCGEAYYFRALAYFAVQDYSRCLQDTAQFLAHQPSGGLPNLVDAHILRGRCLLAQDKPKAALENFLRARSFERSIRTISGVVRGYVGLGKYQAASVNAGELLALDPTGVHSLLSVMDVYSRAGRFDELARMRDRVNQLTPESAREHLEIGHMHLLLEEYGIALECYEEALLADEDCYAALGAKALVLAGAPDDKLRDGRTAKKLAQRILEKSGGQNRLARFVLASALAECGEFSEATRLARECQEALSKDPFTKMCVESLIKSCSEGSPFRIQRDKTLLFQP